MSMFESPRLSLRSRQLARRTSSGDSADILEKLYQSDFYHESSEETAEQSPSEQTETREACFLFMIVGIGYLFPFSALTQPIDYWNLLFPDFNIEFPLTTLYMWSNLIMLAILVFCGGTPNFTRRIVGGFIGQLLVLVVVPTSYFFQLDEANNVVVVMGSTAIAAIVTAFMDSSMIALVAQYPLRVQEYFQLGVGVSTLIGSLYRDATKLAFPPDEIVESSLLYFYTGAATILFCIVAYYRLLQLPLSKKCLAKAMAVTEKEIDDELVNEVSLLLDSPNNAGQSTENQPDDPDPDRYEVLRKVFFNEIMVVLLFLSTLALWPPLVTEIPAYDYTRLQATGWWSLILLTIFSFSDCMGRILVRFRMGFHKDNIWIPVAARLAVFPLILSQVQGWTTSALPRDLVSMLSVSFLGLTNGYVGTLCIVLVNDCCKNTKEQSVAGTFTSFFLNSGLVLGATLGLFLDSWILSR